MSKCTRTLWDRRAKALETLVRTADRDRARSPDSAMEWLEDAYRLARERGLLRVEDPTDPAVIERRRRIGEFLSRVRD